MCSYDGSYTDCSDQVRHFLYTFDNLTIPEKLSFLGMIFDRLENGVINSENKPNSREVSDDGYILDIADCGIIHIGDLAFNLVYAANDQAGGSFPNSEFIDVIDTWIKYTENLGTAESAFNRLSFQDKLGALAKLFAQIGNKQIPFDFEAYEIDGYFEAQSIVSLTEELFTSPK